MVAFDNYNICIGVVDCDNQYILSNNVLNLFMRKGIAAQLALANRLSDSYDQIYNVETLSY